MKLHYNTAWTVWIISISFTKKCQSPTVDTRRRFDDMREITLVAFLIEIFKAISLSGMLSMLPQIVICPMSNPLQFSKSRIGERETVFDITASGPFFGIMGKFIFGLLTQSQILS